MQVVEEKGIEERSNLQSFDPRVLEIAHREYPTMPLAFLVNNLQGLESNLQRLSFLPDIYSPYHKYVNKKAVQASHKKGLKVIPWTVNSKARVRELVRMGVDGIITDYPNLVDIKIRN